LPEHNVLFPSSGESLIAALHVPTDAPRAGLIFLHGWAGYRVGAHRMLVAAAREATSRGYASLRFDFRGRGDSGGATMAATLTTMIEDTLASSSFLRSELGPLPIVLVGDCSGCEVAIGAAPSLDDVRALALWSAPIIGGAREASDAAKSRAVRASYARKLFSAQSWRKLLAGALRWDLIRRALTRGGKGAGEEGSAADAHIDWNARFLSFRGERLFIYGAADPVTPACVDFYRALSARSGSAFDLRSIDGANHAFYSAAWQREVIAHTLDFLDALPSLAQPHA
jgi:alpha-beta hydrolase superfamily lysophospholipase